MTDRPMSFETLKADYISFRQRDLNFKMNLVHALLDASLSDSAMRALDHDEAKRHNEELRQRIEALVKDWEADSDTLEDLL